MLRNHSHYAVQTRCLWGSSLVFPQIPGSKRSFRSTASTYEHFHRGFTQLYSLVLAAPTLDQLSSISCLLAYRYTPGISRTHPKLPGLHVPYTLYQSYPIFAPEDRFQWLLLFGGSLLHTHITYFEANPQLSFSFRFSEWCGSSDATNTILTEGPGHQSAVRYERG